MTEKTRDSMFGPSARRWLEIVAVLLGLYACAIFLRPVMPVDETRYLSVAWEMFLRQDWLAPLTVNFLPYHHKPPLLFWLINASWSVFGVNRAAALLPIVLAAFGAVALTVALSRRLFPGLQSRTQLVMLGSFAFLGYSTAVLFDLTLSVFVLAALLCVLGHAAARRWYYLVALGVLLGLGVLTKGPVMYLYVVFPILLAPFWMGGERDLRKWYLGMAGAFLLSLVPVLLWLVPVLRSSSNEFGYWLVWNQTAGRITGSYGGSHVRPFYFYFALLPFLLLPWVAFPSFWKNLAAIRGQWERRAPIRFLIAWLVPTLIAFSLIAGKQPHYLVPLLPGMAVLIAYLLKALPEQRLRLAMITMLALFVGLQVAGSHTLYKSFDLQPVADVVAEHAGSGQPIAYVGSHYMGQLTYLGRLDRQIESLGFDELDGWFAAHPGGLAVISYRSDDRVAGYEMLTSHGYRSKQMGVFFDSPASHALADSAASSGS